MLRRISCLAGAGLCGVALSQYPEFAQQYEQRLGGAVDELRIITANFDAAATRAGLSRTQALASYERSGDAFLASQGVDMMAVFARLERLSAHLLALEQAGPVERVVDFARLYDPVIGARALEAYQPAVPATPEGAAYAGVGAAAGYGLVALLFGLGRRLFRRRVPQRP